LNERGLREVWDIINGQNSLIVSKIKDIQKRTTVGLYADSTSGWAENESKISEAGSIYIYTDAETFNGKVRSTVKPEEKVVDDYSVWINSDIQEIEVTHEGDTHTEYEFNQVQHTKDEYIRMIDEKNAKLESTITDTQMALCEVYESMG
jgi:hypothetical protein